MTGQTLQQLAAQALAHHQAGRLDQAEAAYRQVLALGPPPGPAATLHYNLAALLRDRGGLDEAAWHYAQSARLNPSNTKAHGNLGAVLERLGRFDEAELSLRRAIALDDAYAHAHYNLGNVLRAHGLLAEAAEAFARAATLNPQDADAYAALALALQKLNRLDEAEVHFRRALALRPDARAHYELGDVLADLGRAEEAAASYRRAMAADPSHAEARNNLGGLLAEEGQADEALALHEAAAALKPDYADAHWNAALIRLMQGDFEAGWPGYEWRLRLKDFGARSFVQPRWDGDDISGRTILLHAEQGAGDSIQFIRYAARLKARGASVILESPAELARLLSMAEGVDRVVVRGRALPRFDVHAPLPSLPGLFGVRLDSIAATATPYLAADAGLACEWRDRLSERPGANAGLVWRGNRAHSRDNIRSMPAATMAGLIDMPDVNWLSLQREAATEELAALSGVEDLTASLTDWADTAALVEALDLVVTVDTAMAHLAGALGKRTLLLLPFVPDWRWLEGREDTPWYPTLRLIRQTARGDWQGVLAETRRRIAELV